MFAKSPLKTASLQTIDYYFFFSIFFIFEMLRGGEQTFPLIVTLWIPQRTEPRLILFPVFVSTNWARSFETLFDEFDEDEEEEEEDEEDPAENWDVSKSVSKGSIQRDFRKRE